MSIKLTPPKAGRTPYYFVRGTYLGQRVYRSTKTSKRALAQKLLRKWEKEIEEGIFQTEDEPTFSSAAIAYMNAGGNRRFLTPLIKHFKDALLRSIDQVAIDNAATSLYPIGTTATRNRQVYTPVSAVLKRAGCETKLRRPKGANGEKRTTWLWPEQTERLFKEAKEIDQELRVLLVFLCYTGVRLGEALALTTDHVRLSEGFAYIPTSKNDEPRAVFLNPFLVATMAEHPRGMERPGKRVFRFNSNGHLRKLFNLTLAAAGITLPHRTGFHVFCHTWATWMRRYGGLDTRGLVGTGRWKDIQSASRYAHVVVTEEARRSSLLPVPGSSSSPGAEVVQTPELAKKP